MNHQGRRLKCYVLTMYNVGKKVFEKEERILVIFQSVTRS
jgi:hypothetical protein